MAAAQGVRMSTTASDTMADVPSDALEPLSVLQLIIMLLFFLLTSQTTS